MKHLKLSTLSPEIIDDICKEVSEGKSLPEALESLNIHRRTFNRLVTSNQILIIQNCIA